MSTKIRSAPAEPPAASRRDKPPAGKSPRQDDPLMVQSVEKALRVLTAFDGSRPTLSLTQLAATIGLDKSATQRFTHTLERLGYLHKDPATKHFELAPRILALAHHYTRANSLIERSMPVLQHLSQTTQETINLTVRDDTDVIFVSRFLSRHVLNTDVVIGTRLPAFCMSAGRAILSALPPDEARDVLRRTDRRPFTPHTVTDLDALMATLAEAAEKGYALAFEQYYRSDISIAAPVLDRQGMPIAAVNIAVSRARFSPEEAEDAFSSLVVAAAAGLSQAQRQPHA